MRNNSSLSSAMGAATQNQTPTIHIVMGTPLAGKSHVAQARSDKSNFNESLIVNGPCNDLMEVLIRDASTEKRLVLIDADTVQDSLSSIQAAWTQNSKKLIVEMVITPLNTAIKRHEPKTRQDPANMIEERIAALRAMSIAAANSSHFEITCNTWDNGQPRNLATIRNRNADYVDAVPIAELREKIQRESPLVLTYLKEWHTPHDRISELLRKHNEASEQAASFLHTISRGFKIGPRPIL